MTLLEWHHGYLGVLLLVLGAWVARIGYVVVGAVFVIMGAVALADDIYQHWMERTHPGYRSRLALWFYRSGPGTWPWVLAFGAWLDRLFGKKAA